MIESQVNQTYLTNSEPVLADLLRSGESDVSVYISQAFVQLIQDIKDRGNDVRRLGKRLSLQTSVTKTDVFTGAISDVDNIERFRLTVNVTAITGTHAFTLQGTNDDGTTYTTIDSLTLSDGTSASTLSVTATGNTTATFNTPYKKYRLKLTTSATTITYSAYLIETTFEEPHRLLSLAYIFNSRRYKDTGDIYTDKYHEYLDLYYKKIDSMRFYYDEDDDGSIGESEVYSYPNVTLSR